jgi:hypothetical protein
MPLVRFETTIPVFERAKAFCTLDPVATVTSQSNSDIPSNTSNCDGTILVTEGIIKETPYHKGRRKNYHWGLGLPEERSKCRGSPEVWNEIKWVLV